MGVKSIMALLLFLSLNRARNDSAMPANIAKAT